jgi:hypothetical protein
MRSTTPQCPRRTSELTHVAVWPSGQPDTACASGFGYFGAHQLQGYPAYMCPCTTLQVRGCAPPSHGRGQDGSLFPLLYDFFYNEDEEKDYIGHRRQEPCVINGHFAELTQKSLVPRAKGSGRTFGPLDICRQSLILAWISCRSPSCGCGRNWMPCRRISSSTAEPAWRCNSVIGPRKTLTFSRRLVLNRTVCVRDCIFFRFGPKRPGNLGAS